MSAWTPRYLLSHVRRTRLLPVLAFYVSASVVIVQVTDIFVDRFGLPDWFFPGAMVLLVVCLPVVFATALVQAGHGQEADPAERRPSGPETRPGSTVTPVAAGAAGPTKHWLTWRKALLGAGLAFAGWGLIAAGFMLLRALGIGPVGSLVAAGVIELREPVLVAEFQNRTPDPYLGGAVTEAFRIDLARSEVVALVEPDRVRSALERMNRPADAPLDAELAREVALREGIKAIVTGDITAAGSGYVLAARLIATEGGEILRAARSEAVDDKTVIAAIDQLSGQLRERMGESLRRIRRGEALERVTTASLDALYRYSRGVRALDIQADSDRGITLLQEAVVLDSTFAMAHRRLGMALRNRGDMEASDAALEQAYRRRDRLTEEERYLAVAGYYSYPGDDAERAIRAYESLLDLYPDHRIALNNLAILYAAEGDRARAASLLRRAIERHPRESRTPYGNLIGWLMESHEIDEAATLVAQMRENFPFALTDRVLAASIDFARWKFEEAEREWRAVVDSAGRDAEIRRSALVRLAGAAAARGRLTEAERLLRQATEVSEEAELASRIDGITLAWMHLLAGQPAEALRLADALLAEHPLLPDHGETAFPVVALYAVADRPNRARQLIDEYDAISEVRFDQRRGPQATWADALIAIAEGRPHEGVPPLRDLAEQCPGCAAPLLSTAFDAMAEPDSAATYALSFFDPVVSPPSDPFVAWLGQALWRVAEARESAGDAEGAASYYARFAELWAEADADLQPRVGEARRRIQSLGRDSTGG